MEPDYIGKVSEKGPSRREDRHDHTIHQHCLDRKSESALNKVDNDCARSAGHVGEEVENCVEDCAELDGLVLDDTECVTCCSEH